MPCACGTRQPVRLPVRDAPSPLGAWSNLSAIVHGLAQLGRRDEVAALADLREALVERGIVWPLWMSQDHTVAGIAAGCAGRWDAAEAHFRAATDRADRTPVLHDRAHVRYWLADMLRYRDGRADRDRARALLVEALPLAQDVGMLLLAREIRTRVDGAGSSARYRTRLDCLATATLGPEPVSSGMRTITTLVAAAGLWVAWPATRAVEARQRPPVMGRTAGVSAGHPLTTAAALEILQQGGNAFDAGVAALVVGGVVEQDLYGFGGEALVLVYPRAEGKVTSVVGQGWAPRGATIEWYRERNRTLDGAGLDPAVVPGAPHGALTVLERWGTMTFEQVSRRAIEHARDGFPLRPRTAQTIQRQRRFIDQWPSNQQTWLKPDGSFYEAGETIALPDLAATFQKMVDAERAAAASGRAAGIQAARDRFYKGDIAREMVRFLQEHGAPFEMSDFEEFYARVEEPAAVTYRGLTVYKQGFNSQGPAMLQTLNILETFDLEAMGHNSADYLHVLAEAMKMAYADRDSYYADPTFVEVPATGLLSKDYARQRAGQIDMARAQAEQVAGDPLPFDPVVKTWPFWIAGRTPAGGGLDEGGPSRPGEPDPSLKDTTHIAVIDKDGNMFDSTPSGGWITGGVVAGSTGVGLSTRGEQFWLDETRAAQLRPRSRPRYTLTPSIVLRDGQAYLAIGTPGGDNQEQTILQAFLNIAHFEDGWYPNLHTAFEWPRIQTTHFLGSFWPHRFDPNRLSIEAGIPDEVLEVLRARGHDVRRVPAVSISGCATAVMIDPRTGSRFAAADPRRDCYAMAY